MVLRVAVTVAPDPELKNKTYDDTYGNLLYMQQWAVIKQSFDKLMDKVRNLYPIQSYVIYPEFQASGRVHAYGCINLDMESNDTAYRCFLNIIYNKAYAPSFFGKKTIYCMYTKSYELVSLKIKREFDDWEKWVEYTLKSEKDVQQLKLSLKPHARDYTIVSKPDPRLVLEAKEMSVFLDKNL